MTYSGVERRRHPRDDPWHMQQAQVLYEGWVKRQPPPTRKQQVLLQRLRRRFGLVEALPERDDYELAIELSTDRERLLAAMREIGALDDAAEARRVELTRQQVAER